MTTDTYPKVATARVKLGEAEVTISGIAKGAGMIAPDMATMLSYVFTDAPIAAPALQAMLSKSVQRSFNCITVDSDTSTSDTLMIFATGAAKGAPRIEDAADPRAAAFRRALDKLLLNLAQQVVRDGEGARKFVDRQASRARRAAKAAKRIAMSIANSPLVKTACAGEDANWGRVVMAVGKAGEKAERDKLDIWFGHIRVAHKGLRDPAYDEAEASAYMKTQTRSRSPPISGSAAERRRSGPATSRRNMSRSTATIAREASARRRRRARRRGRPRFLSRSARRASSSKASGNFRAARSTPASARRTR